jgi:hypothetical protein
VEADEVAVHEEEDGCGGRGSRIIPLSRELQPSISDYS